MKKNGIKEIILFVIKSAIFLWIVKKPFFNCMSILLFLIILIGEVVITSEILSLILFYITFIVAHYLYIVFSYFVAKKLGLVKFIDKSPIWLVVLILVVYEVSLTISFPINISQESIDLYLIHEWKRIILNILRNIKYGQGFVYTFVAYKSMRFLVNKYPKLSFLKKFYFLQKFEDIIAFKNIVNLIENSYNKFIEWWKKNFRWY